VRLNAPEGSVYPTAPMSAPDNIQEQEGVVDLSKLLPRQRALLQTYADHLPVTPTEELPDSSHILETVGVTKQQLAAWLDPNSPHYNEQFARAWFQLGQLANRMMWPSVATATAIAAAKGNPGAVKMAMQILGLIRPAGQRGEVNIIIANGIPRPAFRPKEFRRNGSIEVAVYPDRETEAIS